MFAQNYIFFYILSFLLIITSFLMLILPKFSQMITASALFFLCISGLYLGFNSVYLCILQIFLCAVSVILILITVHKVTLNETDKKSLYSIPRIILGFLSIIIILAVIGMFIYYFKTAPMDNNVLIFSTKNEFSAIISFLITARSVIVDYFLAYGLVIIAFMTILTGIYILIPKDRQLIDNERNNK